MIEHTIAISIIWAMIIVYGIIGSIDLGSGFWAMYFSNRKSSTASKIADQYLSPFWEISNVFLVMLIVSLVSFFPRAAYIFGTILLLPGSIVLLLLLIRSSFMIYAHTIKEKEKLLTTITGITGILIPGILISILPIAQGGFLDLSTPPYRLLLGKLFCDPLEYSFLLFGIGSALFLSSLFLLFFSLQRGDESACTCYKKTALMTGPLTILFAFMILFFIRTQSNWLFLNIKNYVFLFFLSVVAFAIGYILLLTFDFKQTTKRRRTIIQYSFLLQYFFGAIGYGIAHYPYIVYPVLTVNVGMTNLPMYRALLLTTIIGLFLLTPGFYWFMKLIYHKRNYTKQP